MTTPKFGEYVANSQSTPDGLQAETIEERILTTLAVLASGQNPDGTTAPSGGSGTGTISDITSSSLTLTAPTGPTTNIEIPTTYVTLTGAQTLTNKRTNARVLALSANSATPAINTDNFDVVHITAQTAAITSFTSGLTGTPVDGNTLRISVTGTGAVAITWGASFESSTVVLPTTTVLTARLDVGFVWNSETSKWRCILVA